MRHQTEGVVLTTLEYGDADLIVTYATPDRGVVKGFAKSARKIRSRFGSSLEPPTHARIALLGKEGASLPRIVQSDILDSFDALRADLAALTRVGDLVRLFRRFSTAGEGRPRKFGLLLATLHSLESTGRVDFLATVFRVKLLWMSGYGPRFDGCSRCHAGIPRTAPRRFYPSEGAVVCTGCLEGSAGGIPVDPPLAEFFRDARGLRIAELLAGTDRSQVLDAANRLLDAHLGQTGHGVS